MKFLFWSLVIIILFVILIMLTKEAFAVPKSIGSGQISFQQAFVGPRKLLPQKSTVLRTYTARVTVYHSTPGETDSDPFTTANGDKVHWGGVAMNCVPFGTKLRLPKVFGSQIFKVNDRGGMKCDDVDVWLPRDNFHGWKGTTKTLVEILR